MRATATSHGTRRRGQSCLLAILAAGVVFVGLQGAAQAQSPCVSAVVDAPIRFPDGDLRPAGRLTICDWRRFTPVSHLHKTYVNGRPVSLLISKTKTAERGADSPAEVHFWRNVQGQLELIGYVRSVGGRSVTYLFADPNRPQRIEVSRPARSGDDFLVVMARPH